MSTVSLWLPRSRCDAQCLPGAGSVPGAGAARVAARLLAVAALVGLAVLVLPVAAVLPRRSRPVLVRAAARAVLAGLGVRHAMTGPGLPGGGLLVANHVSWLDVLVILAHVPARLLAKREVAGWPVLGWLARAAGTVFVDRARPRTLPGTVAALAVALRHGAVVAVFPEGTTGCGRGTGRFRPAMFQAAVDTAAPVVPVSLRFRLDNGDVTAVAAYLGEDTLWASLRRIAATRGLAVGLQVHPVLYPGPGATRRTLARAARCALPVPAGWCGDSETFRARS